MFIWVVKSKYQNYNIANIANIANIREFQSCLRKQKGEGPIQFWAEQMGLDLIYNIIGAGFNIAYKFNWRRTGLNAKISLVVRIAIKPTDWANIPTVNQRIQKNSIC